MSLKSNKKRKGWSTKQKSKRPHRQEKRAKTSLMIIRSKQKCPFGRNCKYRKGRNFDYEKKNQELKFENQLYELTKKFNTARHCKDPSGQTYIKQVLTWLDKLICGEPGSKDYKELYAKDIQLCRNDWLRNSRRRRSKTESTIQLPSPQLPKCSKERDTVEQQPKGSLIFFFKL